ncbi:MAG: hypothetical protein WD336_01900, partial [Trueperaceae bacterium]
MTSDDPAPSTQGDASRPGAPRPGASRPDAAPRAGSRLPGRDARRGLALVMAGASGVGKGTIREAALPQMGEVRFSVSATTRKRRPGEIDGVQYHFLDGARFRAMI